MVIEVFICASGMSAKSARMLPTCDIGTPTLPTSPRDNAWSESYPVCVGRSKATERPVCPLARLRRKSSLLAAALEWPAYVRMTHAGSLPARLPGRLPGRLRGRLPGRSAVRWPGARHGPLLGRPDCAVDAPRDLPAGAAPLGGPHRVK